MENGFRCEIVRVDADLIELEVAARNEAFAGRTRLFVASGSLEDTATQLSGFPSHPDDTRLLILGAFGPECAGGGVSLAFSLSDQLGRAHAQIVIEADGEVAGITETVTLALGCELAALDQFIGELRRMEADEKGAAVLKAAS